LKDKKSTYFLNGYVITGTNSEDLRNGWKKKYGD